MEEVVGSIPTRSTKVSPYIDFRIDPCSTAALGCGLFLSPAIPRFHVAQALLPVTSKDILVAQPASAVVFYYHLRFLVFVWHRHSCLWPLKISLWHSRPRLWSFLYHLRFLVSCGTGTLACGL